MRTLGKVSPYKTLPMNQLSPAIYCFFNVSYSIVLLLFKGMGDSAHEMLSHHTSRKKKWKHNIQDIFDDELYKNHFNPKEYLHGTSAPARGMEIHLYLMVNTDGVSIFCSSNFSLWPVNFVITGLPPEKRCQIYIFLMLSIGQFITVGGLKVWLLLKIVTHNTL